MLLWGISDDTTLHRKLVAYALDHNLKVYKNKLELGVLYLEGWGGELLTEAKNDLYPLLKSGIKAHYITENCLDGKRVKKYVPVTSETHTPEVSTSAKVSL